MSKSLLCTVFTTLALTTSCSTIRTKDCFKDMKDFGEKHGRLGSPKKYTDELSQKCMGKNSEIDLKSYNDGFYRGWAEYCIPRNALDMGKRADPYISFCPSEQEEQFRQKYLIGKHINELREQEEDIIDEMIKLKPSASATPTNLESYNKLKRGLDKTRQDIQSLEVEGSRNNLIFK